MNYILNYSVYNLAAMTSTKVHVTLDWRRLLTRHTTNLVVKIFFKLYASLSHTVGPTGGKRMHHLGNGNCAIDSNSFVQHLQHAFITHTTARKLKKDNAPVLAEKLYRNWITKNPCRPSADTLCGHPPDLTTMLKIGTPKTPAELQVHTNFVFFAPL